MIGISFSSKKVYDTCPAWYEFKYIKKEYTYENPKNTFLGNTIGKYFEWFYSENLWQNDWYKRLDHDISRTLEENSRNFDKEQYKSMIDETRLKLYELIPRGVDTINTFKLVAPVVTCEQVLNVTYSHPSRPFPIKIKGRSDFIYYYSKDDIRIFDGKASKYRHRNVDKEQLILYALMFYLKYHVIPSQLGFIYWYFPKKPIDMVYLEEGDLNRVLDDLYRLATRLQDGDFKPNPAGHCYICPYSDRCISGKEHLKVNKKHLPVMSKEFDLEII